MPVVSKEAKDIYETYVRRGEVGPSMPSEKSIAIYQAYYLSQLQ